VFAGAIGHDPTVSGSRKPFSSRPILYLLDNVGPVTLPEQRSARDIALVHLLCGLKNPQS